MNSITEEKRGLMGSHAPLTLSNDMRGRSLIGTSNSRTTITDIDSTELLKYCPLGLTGSNPSLKSITIIIL